MANFCNDSSAPLRQVKKVQFGIFSPDEIVSRRSCVARTCAPSCNWDVFGMSLCALVDLLCQCYHVRHAMVKQGVNASTLSPLVRNACLSPHQEASSTHTRWRGGGQSSMASWIPVRVSLRGGSAARLVQETWPPVLGTLATLSWPDLCFTLGSSLRLSEYCGVSATTAHGF